MDLNMKVTALIIRNSFGKLKKKIII